MSCDKKREHHAKDGHDGHKGEHGKRGERGKRGHHGPIGFPGDTGPTGPCCTGPTGTAAPCTDLFKQITEETTTTNDEFTTIGAAGDELCVCFNLDPNGATVRIFVSLSTELTTTQTDPVPPPTKEVYYRITDSFNGGPANVIPGSRAGSEDGGMTESEAGNAIILQVGLPAGEHVICVQWRVGVASSETPLVLGQTARIDPNDATCGMHASLLIEGCDGMTACPG